MGNTCGTCSEAKRPGQAMWRLQGDVESPAPHRPTPVAAHRGDICLTLRRARVYKTRSEGSIHADGGGRQFEAPAYAQHPSGSVLTQPSSIRDRVCSSAMATSHNTSLCELRIRSIEKVHKFWLMKFTCTLYISPNTDNLQSLFIC